MDNQFLKTPYIVATGFTTALLGDERSLREFIIGDATRSDLERKGENVVLYLINDSYDPVNYRQLRVGVNKDEKLLKLFEKYCGRPISEIPDPFDCHENYSQHFTQALLRRLHALDIYPVVLDSYKTYKSGHYSKYISITFHNYDKMIELLSQRFKNFTMKNLFRVQCPKCSCIDSTHIMKVDSRNVKFMCERCQESNLVQSVDEIKGKLSWKLDCAARWNIYGIDLETFSKAHVAELGSFEISRFFSEQFYGGKVPDIIQYGDVKLSRDLSYKLLDILPPAILKNLFASHRTRDLILTKKYVEHFCSEYSVRPKVSYVDYVRGELPKQAIHEKNIEEKSLHQYISTNNIPQGFIDEKSLITYGNCFSRFYYGKEYKVCWPKTHVITSADRTTAKTAQKIIQYALTIRQNHQNGDYEIKDGIRKYLKTENISSKVYHYLRKIFVQPNGPNITTLLAIMPKSYLQVIQMLLDYYTTYDTTAEGKSEEPAYATVLLDK